MVKLKASPKRRPERKTSVWEIAIKCQGAGMLSIDDLQEFQVDLKILSEENYYKLREDILELGFSSPIHVWVNEGRNYILDGHQRLKTLKRMRDEEGFEVPEVPVVWVEADNFKQAKKKVLSLTSQFGEITQQGLVNFIKGADLEFQEIADSFRFPEIDLIQMQKNFMESLKDIPLGSGTPSVPDVVPPPPAVAKSRKGDLYLLGPHKLLCGDTTDKNDVSKLMGREMADMVITAPSWLRGNDSVGDDPQLKKLLFETYSRYFECTKAGGAIYVFHMDKESSCFRSAMVEVGWLLKQTCIWIKDCCAPGRQDYHLQHEPVLYGWKPGGTHHWYGQSGQTTLWNYDRPSTSKELSDLRPIDLVAYPIMNSTRPGELVIDFFATGGSTLLAAHKTGRVSRNLEADPRFVDLIIERYCEVSAEEVYLLNDDGTKLTWPEVKRQR